MSDSIQNPDPKRYVIVRRKGKVSLVDKQVIAWRRRRAKARKAAQAEAQTLKTQTKLFLEPQGASGEGSKPSTDKLSLPNLFSSED